MNLCSHTVSCSENETSNSIICFIHIPSDVVSFAENGYFRGLRSLSVGHLCANVIKAAKLCQHLDSDDAASNTSEEFRNVSACATESGSERHTSRNEAK